MHSGTISNYFPHCQIQNNTMREKLYNNCTQLGWIINFPKLILRNCSQNLLWKEDYTALLVGIMWAGPMLSIKRKHTHLHREYESGRKSTFLCISCLAPIGFISVLFHGIIWLSFLVKREKERITYYTNALYLSSTNALFKYLLDATVFSST